jgi:hypothetical protein
MPTKGRSIVKEFRFCCFTDSELADCICGYLNANFDVRLEVMQDWKMGWVVINPVEESKLEQLRCVANAMEFAWDSRKWVNCD